MFLTRNLLYYIHRRRIPGKISIGKHRWRPRIGWYRLYVGALDMVREQQNMDVLSRPYLTKDEDKVHQMMLAQKAKEEKVQQDKLNKLDNMPKHYTTAEALSHLLTSRKWS